MIPDGLIKNVVNMRVNIVTNIKHDIIQVLLSIRKPNIFEVYQNDELVNQTSTIADYQKQLEHQILKFNYRTFTQVVILGSSTFVPFMELKAPHRREVIEDILDIKLLVTLKLELLARKIRGQ